LADRAVKVLTPTSVHVASLLVGFVVLLVIGRDQWFAYDDWSILHSTFSLWGSHQGHWTTVPTLLFQGLRSTVGFHSYLPYLALVLIAHLAVVHLIWRVSLRAGVAPWWATALTGVTILLGSGAENLFWAFQVGYLGAIAVALVAVLLVDRPTLTIGWSIVAGIVAILALPFSGTALPVLAGAAALSWVRRGLLKSIAIFAPAAIVYVVWYLIYARGQDNGLGVHGVGFLTQAPVFFAAMFAASYGEFTGVLVLGPVVAIALLVWLFLRRKHWFGTEAIAYSLLVASIVYAALTAITRGGGELTASGSQRYVYVMVMFAVPTIGLAIAAISRRGRVWRVAVALSLLALAGVNIALSAVRADQQAAFEQSIQRRYSAAATLIGKDPTTYPATSQPLISGAPDVTVGDIREALADHLVTLVPFTPADLNAVKASLKTP
jgi:hypothetical protein